ncbi:MAG: DNA oxidative demethylase AlkB [Methylophaga sp.]|nr:DNA oxidative demethylase AlkB [Methylophaga sp.]
MQTADLFSQDSPCLEIASDVYLLKHFVANEASQLLSAIDDIFSQAPPRQMQTPGGYMMSARITNCGPLGWATDRQGYRYSEVDPITGQPWPAMPALFKALANRAAAMAGFENFQPDACLINEYLPGAKMGLHQDKDELDFSQPIVSFSLGLPVTFQFGGEKRSDARQNILLSHGDVIVWGRQKRLHYHGVLTLKNGEHPLTGARRINLTFRRAC